MENWLPVPGWEDYYEVSDLGAVRSLPRMARINSVRPHVLRRMGGKVLTPSLNNHGYWSVHLSGGGHCKIQRVHTLVLSAFVGERPEGAVARHLDGNRQNNRADNLKWGTHAENMADRTKHGNYAYGQRHPQSKLTDTQALEIYRSDEPGDILAQRHGVKATKISDIRRGRTWKHVTGGIPLPARDPTGKRKSDKLSFEVAEEMRRKHKAGVPYSKLRKEYGVAISTISAVCTGRTWQSPSDAS